MARALTKKTSCFKICGSCSNRLRMPVPGEHTRLACWRWCARHRELSAGISLPPEITKITEFGLQNLGRDVVAIEPVLSEPSGAPSLLVVISVVITAGMFDCAGKYPTSEEFADWLKTKRFADLVEKWLFNGDIYAFDEEPEAVEVLISHLANRIDRTHLFEPLRELV
jgi:hypothetical protein